MRLSEKIATTRRAIGLTQEEVALRARVTIRTIQRIESGESVPRMYTLRNIATVLNIPFHEIAQAQQQGISAQKEQPDHTHFLKILCLSCFSYLVLPYVHFLVPQYLVRRDNQLSGDALTFAQSLIRRQIGWVIAFHLGLLVTLALNFILKDFGDGTGVINYLWIVFAAYAFNLVDIGVCFFRIKTITAFKTTI